MHVLAKSHRRLELVDEKDTSVLWTFLPIDICARAAGGSISSSSMARHLQALFCCPN